MEGKREILIKFPFKESDLKKIIDHALKSTEN